MIGVMPKVTFLTTGVLPVPAVNGGAVEGLIETLLRLNEETPRFDSHVVSIWNEHALNSSRCYNAFDCFVLPSFYEGSPVVGLEAQATGCPCVFSSEVTEEAKVNGNVSFVPLDGPLERWVETILGYKGSQRSVASEIERYEVDHLAEELDEYYQRLLVRQAK